MPLQLKNLYVFAKHIHSHFCSKIFPLRILFLLVCLSLSLNTSLAGILEKSVTEEPNFEAEDFYQALSAEIYNQMGDKDQAVDFYYQLSANHRDPAIAKRVTELATVTGQIGKALDGAKRWVALESNNLEANQYLALLLIRNGRFTAAAKQLHGIRQLVDNSVINKEKDTQANTHNYSFKTSESLTFIGAMLTAESHHEKAYEVFNLYIKNHVAKNNSHKQYIKQQKLIAAQLAMKAKKYSNVVSYLDTLKDLDAQNHVDAKVMLAKALHKLRKNSEAITHLKSIQNYPEANDSHRLELVRLLVLDKRKQAALPILETLVAKHPKNFDLLKSLIALQISQSQLIGIDNKISQLATNANYVNEAFYFSGEFAEKLGQQEKALSNFNKVESGSYLLNAHKKVISLTKKIEGQSALYLLFEQRQNDAKTIDDQAYWIKLQADELFETHKYKAALHLYNRAVSLAPKKSRYRYKRGLVNERLGNIDDAESDFNFVLAKRKNDFEVLNALGYMLSMHTDRFSEAKSHLEKAFSLKPNDPLVLDSLGFVFYKVGDLDKAEKYLRKAFNLLQKPEVASHLITVLTELNRHQEAKRIFSKIYKKYPNSPSLKKVAQQLN